MKLTLEREIKWVESQCPVTKRWSRNKLDWTGKWTVYNTVGSPSYQTPVFTGTKIQAQNFISDNTKNQK